MNLSVGVDSPQYRPGVFFEQINAWAKRALPNDGNDTFRVDLVDEGVIRLHRYVTTDGKIRAPVESYTQLITGVEMPDLRWFDQ